VDGIQFRNSASVGAAAGNRASDHMLKALLASVIPERHYQLLSLFFVVFFLVWVDSAHLQVLENVTENLVTKDALSAGPDFLGAVGILHATTHERADFNSRR
jgi:hypothetical protein